MEQWWYLSSEYRCISMSGLRAKLTNCWGNCLDLLSSSCTNLQSLAFSKKWGFAYKLTSGFLYGVPFKDLFFNQPFLTSILGVPQYFLYLLNLRDGWTMTPSTWPADRQWHLPCLNDTGRQIRICFRLHCCLPRELKGSHLSHYSPTSSCMA